jgi:hypothetical protein
MLYDDSYTLTGDVTQLRPFFLHFINGGMLSRGWKNWDDVEALLDPARVGPQRPHRTGACPMTRSHANVSQKNPVTDYSRIVHGLWIGKRLSKMELLTIHSFLRHGHEFHLWLYDDLETPLPPQVVVEDAGTILPQSRIFRKRQVDSESGVGRGSVSAPFSDLFR